MLLAIDIGNTNIVVGIMNSAQKTSFSTRISTTRDKTPGEFIKELSIFLEAYKTDLSDVTGVIIASVVPEITDAVCDGARAMTGIEPMVVGRGIDIGITLDTNNPAQLGADLIADAVAGVNEHSGYLAIYDLGTATTLSVVTPEKLYLGTLIIPGVNISKEALVARASQLPSFDLSEPAQFIGKNTLESMKSGIVYGNAAMMDGLIDQLENELGEKVTVLVTGGIGGLICPYCRHEMIYEPELVLKGLWYIHELNKGKKPKL